MEYYTIYKVTNKLNGKTYIGSHKTTKLDDGYMGSGLLIKRAIEKHGVENFEKQVLYVFDNPIEMYQKEAELVNLDYLIEGNTYNLKVGGFGGFDWINSNNLAANNADRIAAANAARRSKFKQDSEYRRKTLTNLTKGKELAIKRQKISDEDIMKAIQNHPNDRAAIKALGLNDSGAMQRRFKRIREQYSCEPTGRQRVS